jgi:hypothetical protein
MLIESKGRMQKSGRPFVSICRALGFWLARNQPAAAGSPTVWQKKASHNVKFGSEGEARTNSVKNGFVHTVAQEVHANLLTHSKKNKLDEISSVLSSISFQGNIQLTLFCSFIGLLQNEYVSAMI